MEELNRSNLGAERFKRFSMGQANLQAMAFFLVVSVSTIGGKRDFTDDELDIVKRDAQDLRDAAEKWASECDLLVEDWRAQRQEQENGT